MNQILEEPNCGWSYLNLVTINGDNKEYPLSYVDDVPTMFIEGLITSLSGNEDVVLSFDAEGWEYKLIICSDNLYIIEEKEHPQLYCFALNKKDFAKLIYDSVSFYFEDWVNWDSSCRVYTDEYISNRSKVLRGELDCLMSLLVNEK